MFINTTIKEMKKGLFTGYLLNCLQNSFMLKHMMKRLESHNYIINIKQLTLFKAK